MVNLLLNFAPRDKTGNPRQINQGIETSGTENIHGRSVCGNQEGLLVRMYLCAEFHLTAGHTTPNSRPAKTQNTLKKAIWAQAAPN